MNYESSEDRIERLENKVSALSKVVVALNQSVTDIFNTLPKCFASAIEQDIAIAKAMAASIKAVVEHSACITDENFRQALIKTIESALKFSPALIDSVEELKKTQPPKIVLPEDLFGPPGQ